jgi:tetratricopeptide (TPR) repeat protein
MQRAGRHAEAETAYRKSAQLLSSSTMTWIALANLRFFAGRWSEGRAVLDDAWKAAGNHATERRWVRLTSAWATLAQDKGQVALDELVRAEGEFAGSDGDALTQALWIATNRGYMLRELGRNEEADALAAKTLERLSHAQVSGSDANTLRRRLVLLRALANLRLGKPAEVRRASAALEDELKQASTNPELRSLVAMGRAAAALVSGDTRTAITSLSRCGEHDIRCRLELLRALEAAKEPRADDVRQVLLDTNWRDQLHLGEDPIYVYARTRIAAGRKAETAQR